MDPPPLLPGTLSASALLLGLMMVLAATGELAPIAITEDALALSELTALNPPIPCHTEIVDKAKEDLAHQLSVEVGRIDVLEVRSVTWPDASLGCPKPGVFYPQVSQDGLLIRLGVAGRMYFYHSGGAREPFLCQETSRQLPSLIPVPDEWRPPPGSETD